MPQNLDTLGLLKLKVLGTKRYNVIIFIHDVTNKILLRALNYIVDVAMWQNFDNSTILAMTLSDFLMFYQIFIPPQVKRIAISSNKHGIYELPNELPNDLTLRILGN